MTIDGKTPQCLANGQLGAGKSVLYTCPAKMSIFVTFFSLFNGSNVSESAHIFIKIGSMSRKIDSYTLAPGSSARVVHNGEGIGLSPGDSLEGYATAAKQIDYVISGLTTSG